MVYIPNTDKEREEIFKVIGVKNFEELISNIPQSLRVKGELKMPPALSEYEVVKHLRELSNKNKSVTNHPNFIGGGAYDHIVPVLVDHVISRSEFYTAYTPYQPEVSQGTLQVMYEFQTCISMLAGLDIANASMYDGASALAEAVLMATNVNNKNKILISDTVHPFHTDVVKTYVQGLDINITGIKETEGITDLNDLKLKLTDDVSAVVIQQPNFLGNLEEVDEINNLIRQHPNVEFIVTFNPISVGLLKSPGSYGADIAVADGQPLGISLSFGGPYIGLFSTKLSNIRKMPGRMSGQTVDSKGQIGYVLTLQTREQHIKREKATSNICTNQGLMALCALTYLTFMGKEGLAEVATQNYNKAHYLADKISAIPGFKLKYKKDFFNEFVVETTKDVDLILSKLNDNNIFGGINLKQFGFQGLMIAVTEKRTKEELDQYVEILRNI
jgi:glycine dehydrogenase subunit 1